jgi:hypothetical protein
MSLSERLRRLGTALRQVDSELTEINERQYLLDRPWEEEFLHWAADGRLHGTLLPPAVRRRLSVTRSGWCPGLAAGRHAAAG